MKTWKKFAHIDANTVDEAKTGYEASGAKATIPLISDSDGTIAENVMRIWTGFAKTGNPSVKGLIEWPAWEPAAHECLPIADPLQIKPGFSNFLKIQAETPKQTIFWP
jgi:carboxylesterase type B